MNVTAPNEIDTANVPRAVGFDTCHDRRNDDSRDRPAVQAVDRCDSLQEDFKPHVQAGVDVVRLFEGSSRPPLELGLPSYECRDLIGEWQATNADGPRDGSRRLFPCPKELLIVVIDMRPARYSAVRDDDDSVSICDCQIQRA